MGTAKIEGDEIVIRIPIAAIETAAPHAWDDQYGFGNHSISVSDPATFAKELVLELNRESETGVTLVHRALDQACVNAAENGAEGLSCAQ